MKNVQEYTGTLYIIDKMKNSINGNPRYMVLVGDTVAYTTVDSGIAYSIGNYDGKRVQASIGSHYKTTSIADVKLAE